MNPIVRRIRDECLKDGLRIQIEDSEVVYAGEEPCSGFFQSQPLQLAVAFKAPNFLGILIHEYCHFRQWKELCPEWTAAESLHGVDSNAAVSAWLAREIDLDKDILNDHIEAVMNLELDCEKRAVNFMRENELNELLPSYIKQANAYVLSYRIVQELRLWNNVGEAPYNDEEILALMPSDFIDVNYKMSDDMRYAFLKCYMKRR